LTLTHIFNLIQKSKIVVASFRVLRVCLRRILAVFRRELVTSHALARVKWRRRPLALMHHFNQVYMYPTFQTFSFR